MRGAARTAVATGWRTSPGLVVLTGLAALGLAVCAVGWVVDDRTVLGVSTWNKPAKFGISFLLFAPTLLAIYSAVPRSRTLRVALEVVGWSMVVEYLLVLLQAARGVGSHFNTATSFDTAVYQLMAAGVGLFTVVAFAAGVALARRRLRSPAVQLAVQLAVPMMTLGAVTGYLMTGLGQALGLRTGAGGSGLPAGSGAASGAGGGAAVAEGHTVGAVDGGPGLPLLGWSTEHGDLRVAHFVGLHAAQVVPLVGLFVAVAVARRWLVLDPWAQRRLVGLAAAGYSGLVVVLAWQALRGQSVVRPDLLTAGALAATVLVPAVLALPDLLRGRRRATTGPRPPVLPPAPRSAGPRGRLLERR